VACTCYRCRYKICQKALESISTRDPQSETCGSNAPMDCAMNCIGCEARKALELSKKG
jgi:hypothetical protein